MATRKRSPGPYRPPKTKGENENEKVETFAKEHGFDIVGEIPRSDEINRCEDQGKTVIEGNPESDISKCFYDLAEILWKDEEQV